MPAQVAWVVVRDFGLELIIERQFPLVDEILNILCEMVDILPGFGVVHTIVIGHGLVAPGTGHDHVLSAYRIRFGDNGPRRLQRKVPGPGPDGGGCAAQLFGSKGVHFDAGPVKDPHARFGYVLHSVGSGASCEEHGIRDSNSLDLFRPPCVPFLLGLAVRVAVGLYPLGYLLVGGQRTVVVLHQPCPEVLPELDELDLAVAYRFAVPASGALVNRIHEVGVHDRFPSEEGVHGSEPFDVQLLKVVYLPPGGD